MNWNYFVALPKFFFVMGTGLQSTATALPYADYHTEVLNSLQSIPTHTWAEANKDKLPNDLQLMRDNNAIAIKAV